MPAAAAVAAGGEVVQQAGAVGVVGEEEEAEREFEVHPAVNPPAGGEGDEDAEQGGPDAQRGHEAHQPPRHFEQAAVFGGFGVFHLCEVHIDARQVKKSGKPGDDEEEVQQFKPGIHFQTAFLPVIRVGGII